jgi:hypothetical protein
MPWYWGVRASSRSQDLRFFLELEDAIEDGMFEGQFSGFAVGQDAFDLLIEVRVFAFAPEIIDHQESAAEEVTAEGLHFILAEPERAGFDHVDEWVIEEGGVS